MQSAVEIYVRCITTTKLLADSRLTLERRTSQLNSIAGLVRSGLRPGVDADRANIEAISARYLVQMREVDEQSALAALAAALGEDPTQPLAAADLESDVFSAPLKPREASDLAVLHRPELRRLEANIAARRADHGAALGLRLPTAGLTASGSISYLDVINGHGLIGQIVNGSAGVYVRWNGLDPTVIRRANVTRAAVEEAQRQYDAGLLGMRAEVVAAAYNAQRAKAQLDQAEQVHAATEVTRNAQEQRYKAGIASILELMDAEALEQTARIAHLEAARDYDIARARVLSTCGVLADKVVK
jgi:outer membrane protein